MIKGSKQSKQSIEKMRLALTGRKLSAEHRAKIGLAHKGRHLSEEWIENIRKSKIGKLNPLWKDGEVKNLHKWVRLHKPKPEVCECCRIKKPFDVANISQKYKRDTSDFEWLCRSCHMHKDGRIKKLQGPEIRIRAAQTQKENNQKKRLVDD